MKQRDYSQLLLSRRPAEHILQTFITSSFSNEKARGETELKAGVKLRRICSALVETIIPVARFYKLGSVLNKAHYVHRY